MIKPKNLKMYRRNYFPDTHKSWLFQQEQPEFNLDASKMDITFAKYNFVKEDINMINCNSAKVLGRKAQKNHLENKLREDIKEENIKEFTALTKSRIKSKRKKEGEKKPILKKSSSKLKIKPPIPKGRNTLIGFSQREQKVKEMLEEEERLRKLKEALSRPEQLISLQNVPTVKIPTVELPLMTKNEENRIVKMKINRNMREEIQVYYEISNLQDRSIPSQNTFFEEDYEEEKEEEGDNREENLQKNGFFQKKITKKLRFNI